jgi:succinoglycan biosynthesis transport protein ExoP
MNMEQEISLRELIEVLLKHKKLIAIITGVTFALSLIISFITPPVYEARTTLLVNPIGSQQKNKEFTSSADVLDTISQYPEMSVETYKEQFLNSEVLQAAIKELDLKDESGNLMKIRSLREKVTVEVIDGTNLIKVSVRDRDPQLASDIVNTLNEKFIDFITAMTKRKSLQAVEAITEQLEVEKKALDEEAKKKRDYLMSSQDIEILNQEIVTLRDQLTAYKSSLIDVDKQIEADLISLKTMEKSGIRSNIDIVEIESKIQLKGTQTGGQAVLGENGENSNSNNANSYKATDSSTMEQAIEIKLTNTSNLSDAMLTAQRTQIETRLVQNVSEKEVLEKKIDELQQRLSDLRATLATEEYKYNEVMRDYELAEASFEAYQVKKSEAEQNAAADIGRASIIVSSPAVVPDIPSSPNKMLNLAIGIVLGLMAGVFVSFFKEYWKNSGPVDKKSS